MSRYVRKSLNGISCREHQIVVKTVLGYMPKFPIEIHHIDENRKNNENNNLVVCQDHSYHRLLHKRAKALKETGVINKYQCSLCKKWFNQNEMNGNRQSGWCKKCHCAYYSKNKTRQQYQNR